MNILASSLGPSSRQIKMAFPNISNADQLVIDLEELAESYNLDVGIDAISALANVSDVTSAEVSRFRFESTRCPYNPECILFILYIIVTLLSCWFAIWWKNNGLRRFSFSYCFVHAMFVNLLILLILTEESICEICYSCPDLVPVFKSESAIRNGKIARVFLASQYIRLVYLLNW